MSRNNDIRNAANPLESVGNGSRFNPLPNGGDESPREGICPAYEEENGFVPEPWRVQFFPYISVVCGAFLLFAIICVLSKWHGNSQVAQKYEQAVEEQKTSESNKVWEKFFPHPPKDAYEETVVVQLQTPN